MRTWQCSLCGQRIYRESGVGLVTVESGDDGGTFDICPGDRGTGHEVLARKRNIFVR